MTDDSGEPEQSANPTDTAFQLIGHKEQLRGHMLFTTIKLGILKLLDGKQTSADNVAT